MTGPLSQESFRRRFGPAGLRGASRYARCMSAPRVVAVAPGSPAERAGIAVGDEVAAVNGESPRDIIRWKWLTDDADPVFDVVRGGLELTVELTKRAGEPLGIEVHSALFDQLRTCDNHCEFCFIYQLPPGLRPSLYLKDDDYRLCFLYGNFTTLTRFTEADLERVVTEGLSPLNVSIHATDPDVRATMLRNRRGATSLRWLRALLDHGVEVHGQIVVCPGPQRRRGARRHAGRRPRPVSRSWPACASCRSGVSRFNPEPACARTRGRGRPPWSTPSRTGRSVFRRVLGHRLVFAADEYYLLAGRPFPERRGLRGLLHARGRHRHGPHVRDRVQRPDRRRRRACARVLRLGRRRAGR